MSSIDITAMTEFNRKQCAASAIGWAKDYEAAGQNELADYWKAIAVAFRRSKKIEGPGADFLEEELSRMSLPIPEFMSVSPELRRARKDITREADKVRRAMRLAITSKT